MARYDAVTDEFFLGQTQRLAAVHREPVQFDEALRIEKLLDPFARGEFATLVLAGNGGLAGGRQCEFAPALQVIKLRSVTHSLAKFPARALPTRHAKRSRVAKVLLLQFDSDPQCTKRTDALRKLDAQIVEDEPHWPTFFDAVTRERPDVIVIACSRIPSHGREAARYLNEGFNTRDIPVILVDVLPADLEKTRNYVPQAAIVTSDGLVDAVRERISADV